MNSDFPQRDSREPTPALAWMVEPICGELGLFDLVVADSTGREGVEIALEVAGERGRPFRCHGEVRAGDRAWKARVLGGGAGGPVRFWLRRLEGGDWEGPFIAQSAPPADLAPPAWALGAVWYQVFPERFANGRLDNDPRGPEVFAKAWASSWKEVGPDELEAARARTAAEPVRHRFDPNQPGGALYGVVLARRYGGDLEGLHSRLEHLSRLGITAIYLNPVFSAPSLHKYDAVDYRHIDATLAGDGSEAVVDGETLDPATWRWTGADRYFLEHLLPGAKGRGMRVILDGVWNHTSTRFWAFEDIRRRGKGSAYSRWYNASFEDDRLVGWKGWDRANGNLPEFARGEDGNLVPEVRTHIEQITRRWMDPDGDGDPSDGIDGWRLDVANDMPMAFWREWCALVRGINPGAVSIGELWHVATEHLRGGVFDAQMNYPFARAVVAWLDGRPGFGSAELGRALMDASGHPARVNLAQMNLLDSHDTARLATMLANPGRGYGGDEKVGRGAAAYVTGRPPPEVYDLVVLGVAMQVLWPGSPMVYGGDEWGVHGADDPDNRKPVPWPDLAPYDDPADAPDSGLPERFGRWLRLRSDPEIGPVLRYGSVSLLDTGNPDVIGFVRCLNGKRVLAILNRGRDEYRASDLAGQVEGVDPAWTVRGRAAECWAVPGQ